MKQWDHLIFLSLDESEATHSFEVHGESLEEMPSHFDSVPWQKCWSVAIHTFPWLERIREDWKIRVAPHMAKEQINPAVMDTVQKEMQKHRDAAKRKEVRFFKCNAIYILRCTPVGRLHSL